MCSEKVHFDLIIKELVIFTREVQKFAKLHTISGYESHEFHHGAVMSMEYVSDKLSHVFRSYDIRGKVNNPLNNEIYYQIGQKISRYLMNKKRTKIYIARDNRLSSKRFFKVITKAFINQGIEVYNLSVCSTPIMLYACKATKIDSGVIITASHNPCDYNGLKLFLAGKLLTPSELIELKNSPSQQDNHSEIKKGLSKKRSTLQKLTAEHCYLRLNQQDA